MSDNIIYGSFNKEVIKAIKKSLRLKEVNPLYIYGPSGSGKSFLIRKMKEEHKGKAIIIESKKFDASLINEYLDYDLLIIEDLELIPLRSPIPETLFDIIDYFIENEKQIVITSDSPPANLKLPDRIISRIESGVVVSIKYLDESSREKAIRSLGKDLPPNIQNQLKERDIKTISQLIGEIKKVRVLGYVSEEEKMHRATKSTPVKEPLGEYDRFINEVRESFSEAIDRTAKEQKLREEYNSKMYVWKMKGFNTSRISKVIDGPIDKLTSEFVSFTMDIQRLIELQRRYGALDLDSLQKKKILTEDDIKEIEKALFNPDKADWLNRKINELEDAEMRLKQGTEVKTKKKGKEEASKKEPFSIDNKKILDELKIELKDKSNRLIKEY